MKKSNEIYLEDILQAIEVIEEYIKNIDFGVFGNDQMRHDAVIRQLEIIGEASNKLDQNFIKNHADFPIKQAVEMRNFLIHGYDEVKLETVWKTVNKDLPPLKIIVKKILGII
ncbi:DUF86 domain-containing protein [Patescibacteria group bacterium]|nr:DUF86 domain-containing protein [Patescibacteria group bacterium]MBU1499477.1 DUF86 domain-containing protein [Patescibacteria group bacterium]